MKNKKSNMTAMPSERAEWKARSDLTTLQQARDIQNDPARLKRCMAMAEKEVKGIMNVMPGRMQDKKKKLLAKMMM